MSLHFAYSQSQASEPILETYSLNIRMTCEKCPPRIAQILQNLNGFKKVDFLLREQEILVCIDTKQISAQAVLATLLAAGEIASFKNANQQRPHF